MRTLTCLALSLLVLSCKPSSEPHPDFRMILYYQDNRAPADSLYPFLQSKDHHIQIRTIQALGQLQDTAAIDTLCSRLAHPFHDLREEAIFSLGQIGYGTTSVTAQSRICMALTKRYPVEQGTKHKSAILQALGKCGDADAFTIVSTGLRDTTLTVVEEASLAAGRLAIRGFMNDAINIQLSELTGHPSADVRWMAVYAMMRIHDKRYVVLLIPLLNDADNRIRMDAARALGAMGLGDSDSAVADYQNALIRAATSDGDWRVRVNAVNALGSFKFGSGDLQRVYFLIAFEGRKDKNEHVRIAAIRSMARSYRQDLRKPDEWMNLFAGRFLPAASPREKGEILLAACQMMGEKVFFHSGLTVALDSALVSPDRYLRAQAVTALGETRSEKTIPYLEKALTDTFALVANNAAEALGRIGGKTAFQVLMKSLDTSNPVLLLISSGVLSAEPTLKSDNARREKIAGSLIATCQRIVVPIDADIKAGLFDVLGDLQSRKAVGFLETFLMDSTVQVAQSAARNLKKITGQDYTDKIRMASSLHPIDFDFYVRVKSRKPSATIETDKGDIVMDFFPDDAPFSVVNFVQLAERKYFDGTLFHRVVPNFVIQGGDPEGTGWGGPGYSIRSEFNDYSYERGMVGMASSGRDTEGSQWFITHSPQSHLDGRYTIFARVIDGMDVVDRIQVGDSIRSVRIKWY